MSVKDDEKLKEAFHADITKRGVHPLEKLQGAVVGFSIFIYPLDFLLKLDCFSET
jgi:hypothetical protein